MNTLKIIKEELLRVYSSKTIDALLPPIVFILVQDLFDLKIGLISAISFAALIAIFRIIKGEKVVYALGGIFAVALAGGYAFYTGSAKSYFIPKLINSGLLFIITSASILFKRPIVAYLSHISRGWPLQWFWQKDVKPAYNEVTLFWSLLFGLKFIILFYFYKSREVSEILWVNFIIDTSAAIIGLIMTYLYGSDRLKKLKGPSVDEFLDNKKPPYSGQNRDFDKKHSF